MVSATGDGQVDDEFDDELDGEHAEDDALDRGSGDDFDDEDDEDEDDDDGDELDDDELDEDDDELDDDEDEGDELDDDELDDDEDGGYEAGDVNTVAAEDYETGDVNTIAATAGTGGGPSAPETARRGGEMPTEVLDYLARALADDPDAVVIRREDRRGSLVLRLHVAPQDMGRVIGRRGRTAQAIRTLVGVAGARGGIQTLVDIVDD